MILQIPFPCCLVVTFRTRKYFSNVNRTNVFVDAIPSLEHFFTVSASKFCLGFCMGLEVGLQVWSLTKALTAHRALVGWPINVKDLMHGQSSSLTETFPAHSTLKRLVFRVDELVVPQMVLPPKWLAADITGKRPLISVGPLMDQEVVGFGELSLAVLADVLLLQSFGKGCLWLLRFGGFC